MSLLDTCNQLVQKTIKTAKELVRALYVWDGIWSLPLSFCVYLGVAFFGQLRFGESWASYSPSILHGAVTAAMILIGFNFITLLGLYFNFKGIFDFITGPDFKGAFKELTPWQKILLSLLFYLSFLLLAVVIFCALV